MLGGNLLNMNEWSSKDLKRLTSSKYDHLSDQKIWNEFRKGDDLSFLFLYNKYFDVLYGFGFQFSKDPDFVKDCIQDLFIELIDKRKRLSSVRSIKAYLLVSLKRKIFYYQKRGKRLIYKSNLLEGYDFQINISHEDSIINQQFDKEKKDKLNKEINNILTKRQREVIFYLYYERLTVDDVADLMMVSRRSVQNLIYKAVKLLKNHFAILVSALLKLELFYIQIIFYFFSKILMYF